MYEDYDHLGKKVMSLSCLTNLYKINKHWKPYNKFQMYLIFLSTMDAFANFLTE